MPLPISNTTLDFIRNRRHAGAMMLAQPGPTPPELEALLEAAAAAPDHGKLVPFRFVIVQDAQRAAYVEASLAAFRMIVLEADEQGLHKVRAKAQQPPVVVGLVGRVQEDHPKIMASDQWLTVGCVLQNLWLACESLSFACGVSSGRLMETQIMRSAFGLAPGESLVSIISIGTPKERLPARTKPLLSELVSSFPG